MAMLSAALDEAATNGEAMPMIGDVDSRKLVVLGLPWDTGETALQDYFSQFGPLAEAMVMKDRFSGKSRGFGFVTFWNAADAAMVVNREHVVDGRRCEAKFALARGGGPPARNTRIFVARIPASVGDAQFRAYFENFGTVQDAYMPKDASKSMHRGIGFVTFASAEPVETVMSTSHKLNGQELAIDRATPKDKVRASAFVQVSLPLGSAHRMRDPHAMAASAGLLQGHNLLGLPFALGTLPFVPGVNTAAVPGLGPASQALSHMAVPSSGFLNGHSAGLPTAEGYASLPPYSHAAAPALVSGSGGQEAESGEGVPEGGAIFHGVPGQAAPAPQVSEGYTELNAGAGVTARTLQDYLRGAPLSDHTAQALQGLTFGGSSQGIGIGMGLLQARQAAGLPPMGGANSGLALEAEVQARAAAHAQSLLRTLAASGGAHLGAAATGAEAAPGQVAGMYLVPGAPGQEGHVLAPGVLGGAGGDRRRSVEWYPGAAGDGRAGPRIFVGKLNKDTMESDVKEYFTRFGYVMDVYMPRDKVNRSEHRGFGFVTFETEAAIARIHAHGQHQIRGSVIAIDDAVPRREEGGAPAHAAEDEALSALARAVLPGHASPGHAGGAHLGPGIELAAPGAENLAVGPARHHAQERARHGYKPY